MPAPQPDEAPGPGDTSYVCVIDRHGNAFSATPSDGSNNTPIIPGVGILCSGRGTQSWADPTHPSSVAPGKRPRLTPSPALALKNGQRLHAVRHARRRRAAAGDAAGVPQHQRVRHGRRRTRSKRRVLPHYSYPGSFEPHAYFPGRLYLESRIDKATGDALASRGHKVYWWDDMTWLAGAVCTIVADHKAGVLHGGADPRRPAYVLGW